MFGGFYFGDKPFASEDLKGLPHIFTTSSMNGVVAGPPGVV